MLKYVYLFVCGFFLKSTAMFGQVIYNGVDTRSNVIYQSSYNDEWEINKRAVAAIVRDYNISPLDSEHMLLQGGSLNYSKPIFLLEYDPIKRKDKEIAGYYNQSFCSEEKLIDRPQISDCSGVLIKEDILMTAGHCLRVNKEIEDQYRYKLDGMYFYDRLPAHYLDEVCKSKKYVFDMIEANYGSFPVGPRDLPVDGYKISNNDIYECERVIFRQFGARPKDSSVMSAGHTLDFAFIKVRPFQSSNISKHKRNLNILRNLDKSDPYIVSNSDYTSANANFNYYMQQADYYENLMNQTSQQANYYRNDPIQYQNYLNQIQQYRTESNRYLDLANQEMLNSYNSQTNHSSVIAEGRPLLPTSAQATNSANASYQEYLNNYYQNITNNQALQQTAPHQASSLRQPNLINNNSSLENSVSNILASSRQHQYQIGNFVTYDYNEYLKKYNEVNKAQSQGNGYFETQAFVLPQPNIPAPSPSIVVSTTPVINQEPVYHGFGRAPVMLNTNAKLTTNSYLVNIGHPRGISMVMSKEIAIARIIDPKDFFLDETIFKPKYELPVATYSGSSGSPVFNWSTNLLEGIVVRAPFKYYRYDTERSCIRSSRCPGDFMCKNSKGADIAGFKDIYDYLSDNFPAIFNEVF